MAVTAYDWRELTFVEVVSIFIRTFSHASIEVWERAMQLAEKKNAEVTVALIGSDERWSFYMIDTTWLAAETETGGCNLSREQSAPSNCCQTSFTYNNRQ